MLYRHHEINLTNSGMKTSCFYLDYKIFAQFAAFGRQTEKYDNKTQMEGDDKNAKKPRASALLLAAVTLSSVFISTICLRRGVYCTLNRLH